MIQPTGRRVGAYISIVATLLSSVLAACSQDSNHSLDHGPIAATPAIQLPNPADLAITGALAAMTTRTLAGQMIIAGMAPSDGTISGPHQTLEEVQPGGVVLYAEDMVSIDWTRRLVERLGELLLIAPFVVTDQEGGLVARLATSGLPATVIPSAARIGRVLAGRDEDEARQLAVALGRLIGSELRSLGISCNLAPVADIAGPGTEGAIGSYYRSYGADPGFVGMIVSSIVVGMQEAGVASIVKHFPGHGDAIGDTHDGIAMLDLTFEQLQVGPLISFASAISAGVAGVMTAHVALPHLTGSLVPGTLSSQVVTGLLREQLGFSGLIVTDALNMSALQAAPDAWFDPSADPVPAGVSGEARLAVRSLLAGADLILLPVDPVEVLNAIVRSVDEEVLERTRLEASARRVLLAKIHFGVIGPGAHAVRGDAAAILGSAEHQSLARILSGLEDS
jgi:beta-N-acetylhexosaminidase